jgi:pyridoxamine 5'-phosphate oxidase-like protein
VSWIALEAGAPDLARTGRERLQAAGVALLGTIRRDGTPRISPVEPYFLGGHLVFGVMGSPKWDDLKRDPRCVLHSPVKDSSGAESEFKVYGRAVRTDDPALVQADSAWWSSRPRESFEVFTIEIGEAVLVAWDPDFGRMQTRRWRPDEGAAEAERSYP